MSDITIPDRRKSERINWATRRHGSMTENANVAPLEAQRVYTSLGQSTGHQLKPAALALAGLASDTLSTAGVIPGGSSELGTVPAAPKLMAQSPMERMSFMYGTGYVPPKN